VDLETIDRSYRQLEGQAQQTIQALSALAQKLQQAAAAGDPNAREWMLDLKEIALQIRDEQNQVADLLQALHGFVATQLPAAPSYAQPAPTAYPQPAHPPAQPYPPSYPQPVAQGGGMLHRFLGSSFGQAIGMGAGFGLGEDLIKDIFDR